MHHADLRERIVQTARALNEQGLSAGSSGNVSARVGDEGFLITPSGVKYHRLAPEDVVLLDFAGAVLDGDLLPSSEWRLHLDIYAAHPAGAIVHAHPPYATALACLERGIPAFHYMVAVAGGKDIRCSRYELFGSSELPDPVLDALEGRKACLMGHHGLIAYGDDPEKALGLAVEVETLARQYHLALQVGEPELLSDAQMEVVLERFKSYGENAQKAERLKSR